MGNAAGCRGAGSDRADRGRRIGRGMNAAVKNDDGGGGAAPPFGIVVAFRDTPREREFAEKSLPSAIALDPDELIVGIDGGDDNGLADFTSSLCERHGLAGRLSIVRVERSSDWRFHLANVIWHCYKASRNDAVLSFNIDSVLRRAALRGAGVVGRDGVAAALVSKRILVRNPSEYVRLVALSLRARIGTSAAASSGTYWLHLPWYFANVTRDGLAGISNGIDDYMLTRIVANDTHKIARIPGVGVVSLDIENPDYPWRQFADGMWHGANGLPGRAGPRAALRQAALAMAKAAAYQRPHVARGWLWAVRHPDSEACRAARATDFIGWVMEHGSKYVRDREWGRKGTGF